LFQYIFNLLCSWKFQIFVNLFVKFLETIIMTGEPTHTYRMKCQKFHCAPNYISCCIKGEISSLCISYSVYHYTVVQINNCLRRTSAIKAATMKFMDNFRNERKPSRATTKSTPFVVSKDEWDTKKNAVKLMKSALNALWCADRHLSGWSNVE